MNSIHGRQCSCNEGFENQDQNPSLPCQDINECDGYYCGQGECINNDGSYSCDCFDGFYNFKNDSSLFCGK